MDVLLAHRQSPDPIATDLIAEANHRIANSLTLLVSMVRMQSVSVKKHAEPFSNADVRHLLDGIAARINTISQLHRILALAGDDGAICLKPHLHEVTDALVAALSSPDQPVQVVHAGSDSWCRCARCSRLC
jgi:two-component sensor histidine kinase